ncbi:aminotransferase class IV [Corallococcus llansteffanensis]|uniref:branched-chain-amino-acid transaminase n=1 Tax=Corallococcus llansteffanensis TaxID=2316731 RepID=A0A3A8QEZ5_9BACT|nr:aminotransferase class IV [Corallococcus llansteffanensis]RKH64835.1 aminotransferase IV [Corallococcus llansteffanensis]
MSIPTVCVDGVVQRWEDLRLQDFAQGFFFGAGFFTTFRIDAGRPLFLARHLSRLRSSLAAFPTAVRAPEPALLHEDAVRDSLRRCLEADSWMGPRFTGVGKLVVSDGHVLCTFRPLAADFEALHREGRTLDSVEAGAYRRAERTVNHKGLAWFRQHALLPRLPIITNEADEVCELPTANLFVQLDGALVTPPLDSPCLPGIARGVLLEVGRIEGLAVVERAVRLADLSRAQACFFSNAVALAVGVPHLLGRTLPDSLRLAERARAVLEARALHEG